MNYISAKERKKILMEKPIIKDIYDRLNKKYTNCVTMWVGRVGTGKSLGASEGCMMISPKFKVKDVFFRTNDFFEVLIKEKFKAKGSLQWEEMGVSADSRSYMSTENQAISHAMETWRDKMLHLAMTVPSMGLVDSRLRMLTDYMFVTDRTYRNEKGLLTGVSFKTFRLQHNPAMGKTYIKYPIFNNGDTCVTNTRMYIPAPPEDFIQEYLIKKKEFNQSVNLKGLEVIEDKERMKAQQRGIDYDGLVKEVLNDVESLRNPRGKVTISNLEAQYDISRESARKLIAKVQLLIKKDKKTYGSISL